MKSSIVNGENRGSVNNLLLKALSTGDKYGYEINKEIETKSKGKYFLKEASLYSGLKRLEANGYITSYWLDGELGIKRHYYSITQSGLEKLKSSNFSFDSSKEFIGDMFNNNLENQIKVTQQPENKLPDSPVINETIVKNEENEKNVNINKTNIQEKPVEKKNPFAIEVNPLQQSIFDLTVDNFNQNNNENILENVNEINNDIENKNVVEENNVNENLLNIEETKNDATINTNNEKVVTEQVTYDDLINQYSQKNFTDSINSVENKIEINKLLNAEKNNSIILTNNNNINNANENKVNLETKIDSNEEMLSIKEEEKEETETISNSTESSTNILNLDNNKEENKLDIKNIFGNLLVENEDTVDIVEQKIENTEHVEQPIRKELPRIDVDNNINVMLNSNSAKQKPDFPTHSNNEALKSGTNNIPSVKQYINNVHKKTLISRATNVNEEVNLEGINIREYVKMNNKPIKNSNYVYINKINLFLNLILCGLLLIESIIAFVVFNNVKALSWVETILLSGSIITAVILGVLAVLKYNKDKFKIELKHYNFKTNLFYSILIFIVSVVILICINLFEGVNPLLSDNFIVKIILETIIILNIALYPIIKVLLYNSRRFSS